MENQQTTSEDNPVDLLAKELLKVLNGKTHSLSLAAIDQCKEWLSTLSIVAYS